MVRKILLTGLCLMFLTTLSGCGIFAPSADDPRLVSEYEAAREALQEAEFHNADKLEEEKYEQAVTVFESVREEHQQSPSEEIIPKYRRAQVMANRATIDALRTRLEQEEKRLKEANREVSELESSLQETRKNTAEVKKSLADYKQTAEELREAEKKTKNELEKLKTQHQKQSRQLSSLRAERNQLEKDIEEYQQVIDNMQKNIEQVRGQTRRLQAQLNEKSAELKELQQENKAIAGELKEKVKEIQVRHENRGVVINLESRILFDVGDDLLKDRAKKTLQKVAGVLNNYPEREIRVEGHTCDLPMRERYPSNWELSAHRALAVLKYLVYAQDVSKHRIAAVAHGQFSPLVPNTSDKNRQLNRRVEITLLPPALETETKPVKE
jgi:chemotaxis protein MotB